MGYCTEAQVQTRWGSALTTRLADRDNSGSADTGVLAAMIAAGAADIDASNTELTASVKQAFNELLAFYHLCLASDSGKVPMSVAKQAFRIFEVLDASATCQTVLLSDPANKETYDSRYDILHGPDDWRSV